eukprot:gene16901-25921_t
MSSLAKRYPKDDPIRVPFAQNFALSRFKQYGARWRTKDRSEWDDSDSAQFLMDKRYADNAPTKAKFEQVFAELRETATVGIKTYNEALVAAARLRDGDMADKLLREMKEASIKPNGHVYNTAMRAHAERGDTVRVRLLWLEMENAGLEPSDVSYVSALRAFSAAGDEKGALEVFSDLIGHPHLKPTPQLWASLISSCHSVASVRRVMEKIPPEQRTEAVFDRILQVAASAQQPQLAFDDCPGAQANKMRS